MKTLINLILILSWADFAYACPGCKEALHNLSQAWTWIGFNWSILFMLSIPYLLIASFAGAIFMFYRKSQKSSL